jgi:hypothetical protein
MCCHTPQAFGLRRLAVDCLRGSRPRLDAQRTGLTMGSSAGLDLATLRVASRRHHMFRTTRIGPSPFHPEPWLLGAPASASQGRGDKIRECIGQLHHEAVDRLLPHEA